MKHQKGYIDIDLTGILLAVLFLGCAIGIVLAIVLAIVIPWLWLFLKPFIHALSA